jgi:multimeric flavodoxin WrbA
MAKKLLVIYHSQTGNTEAMAKAVYEGASSAGAAVTLKKATDATEEDLLTCDAVAFGSPVYFGYMAGALKGFFDRAWLTIRDSVVNKPYTAFGSAGSGGRQALDSIDRLCMSFRLKKAFGGVIATGKPSSDVLEQCKELGRKLAQL